MYVRMDKVAALAAVPIWLASRFMPAPGRIRLAATMPMASAMVDRISK